MEISPVPLNGMPLRELRSTGLLWLINRVVFHPRGFALTMHFDKDGEVTGWSLQGDGSEAWDMGGDEPQFSKSKAFLESHAKPAPKP